MKKQTLEGLRQRYRRDRISVICHALAEANGNLTHAAIDLKIALRSLTRQIERYEIHVSLYRK